jgi:hypothetical protein
VIQVATRAWPAEAVHDTVQAVFRGAEFRRSLGTSIIERTLMWLADVFGRLVQFLRGTGSARAIALGFAALIVLAVLARLLLAARAREPAHAAGRGRGRTAATGDPWQSADELARAGRFEEAAHALYRAVLLSLAQTERVRLDASKTSGDYARELRARGSSTVAPFRRFSHRFDVAVYGHDGCDAELVDELRRLAEPLRLRARAA